MNDELDEILFEQYHSAKKTMKLIKRLKKIFPEDENLMEIEKRNKLRQNFFEDMVQNKIILVKKTKKKKKEKTEDLLDRNPIYYVYRNTIMAAAFSYMFFTSSVKKYWEHLRKNNNEKT